MTSQYLKIQKKHIRAVAHKEHLPLLVDKDLTGTVEIVVRDQVLSHERAVPRHIPLLVEPRDSNIQEVGHDVDVVQGERSELSDPQIHLHSISISHATLTQTFRALTSFLKMSLTTPCAYAT